MKYNITDIIKRLSEEKEGSKIYDLGTQYTIAMQKELYHNDIFFQLYAEFIDLYNKQASNRDIALDNLEYKKAQLKKVSKALLPTFKMYEQALEKKKN